MFSCDGRWRALLALALALGLNGRADSILPSTTGTPDHRIKSWTTQDGLPQNRIACLTHSRDGYLWIGTWFGLVRFDGMTFTVFKKANTPEFEEDAISSLAEDSSGSLWIGTKNGLLQYNHGVFHRFTRADGLPDNAVWRLASAPDGSVWMQSGDDAVREHTGKFETLWRHPGGDLIHGFNADAHTNLNVFLNHAWVQIDPFGGVKTNYSDETFQHKIMCGSGLCDGKDAAILSLSTGLVRVQSGSSHFQLMGDPGAAHTELLLRDQAGGIWAKVKPGHLVRFQGLHAQNFILPEPVDNVICADEDVQGNIWLGAENGLARLTLLSAHSLTKHDGLPDDNVITISQAVDGTQWIGTSGGLAMLENGKARSIPLPGGTQSVFSIVPAAAGGVWVGTRQDGILHVQNGSITAMGNVGLISTLLEDKGGNLWAGTTGALALYSHEAWQSLPAELESLHDVHSILQSASGTVWFASASDLALWDHHSVIHHRAAEGLPPGIIWSMTEDRDHALWLGTEKGLVRFAKGKFFRFTPKSNLPDGPINCVLLDDADHLWCSTLNGVYRLERERLNWVADGSRRAVPIFVVGMADGMASAESNGDSQPAGWKSRDGHLWFATGKGAVEIDPGRFSKKPVAPPVVFESVRAKGEEFYHPRATKASVPAGFGDAVQFNFTACDLTAPEQEHFRTRLVGASKTWSERTLSHSASFFSLAPGAYRLEVIATDHHGTSSIPAHLAFSIAPFYWQRPEFYIAVGFLSAVIIGTIILFRSRWQRRLQLVERQHVVAMERTRIARDLHDDLGTALTGLALELDVLKPRTENPTSVADQIALTSEHIRQLAGRMREVVWAVNPQCDTLRSVADFLDDQTASFLRNAGLENRLDMPEEIPDLPVQANVRHQLALSVREALSNIVRHAHATEVRVSLDLGHETLAIRICDNGCGFDPAPHLQKPHGLDNLRTRMNAVGGEFECTSTPGVGTVIRFKIPFNRLNPPEKPL